MTPIQSLISSFLPTPFVCQDGLGHVCGGIGRPVGDGRHPGGPGHDSGVGCDCALVDDCKCVHSLEDIGARGVTRGCRGLRGLQSHFARNDLFDYQEG